MYSVFIACDVTIGTAQIVAQYMRHVDYIIQRGLQDFLPSHQGYGDVRAVPPLPSRLTDTPDGC